VKSLAKSSLRDRLKLVTLAPHKDPSALWIADPHHGRFKRFLDAALDAAIPLAEYERQAREAAAASLREQAKDVLDADDPLALMGPELARLGWGGDVKPLKVIYLAMTTRLLPIRRGALPCHTQINGEPGGGKTFALNTALTLLPSHTFVKYD